MESGLRPAPAQLDNRLRRFPFGEVVARHKNSLERTARPETAYSLSSDTGTERKKRSS